MKRPATGTAARFSAKTTSATTKRGLIAVDAPAPSVSSANTTARSARIPVKMVRARSGNETARRCVRNWDARRSHVCSLTRSSSRTCIPIPAFIIRATLVSRQRSLSSIRFLRINFSQCFSKGFSGSGEKRLNCFVASSEPLGHLLHGAFVNVPCRQHHPVFLWQNCQGSDHTNARLMLPHKLLGQGNVVHHPG